MYFFAWERCFALQMWYFMSRGVPWVVPYVKGCSMGGTSMGVRAIGGFAICLPALFRVGGQMASSHCLSLPGKTWW